MNLSFLFLSQALPKASYYYHDKKYESVDLLMKDAEQWFVTHAAMIEFSIDSRTIQKGQLYLVICGEKYDGHSFVQAALEKGAVAIVIEKKQETLFAQLPEVLTKNVLCILVDDTLQALTDCAHHWRMQFTIPIVGVTGSIGKTTTKEMVKEICKVAGINACVNAGNQNNNIGLSLNLLKLNSTHQVGVFEVGISHKGEMAELADILQPTLALITNVWHVHVDGIGDLESIAYEKRQLFKNFAADNIGLIFGDQPLLEKAFYKHPVIKFGMKIKNQIQASKVAIEQDEFGNAITLFKLSVYKNSVIVKLFGSHPARVANAVGAAAIAYALKISMDKIVEGLGQFQTVSNHFQPKEISGKRGVLISDCCNASPESMRASLLAFHSMNKSSSKIAVLGDMLELGKSALFWHRQIGRTLAKTLSIDTVILVGPLAKSIAQTMPLTMKMECVNSWQEAQKKLEALLAETEALVLVKGSKAVGLEYMVKELAA